MQSLLSRWCLFGLLIGWALSHASVFGQTGKTANAKTSADKLRQGLDKAVTVDYTGQSLTEVLNHLGDKSGLAFSVDQAAFMQFGMNPDAPIGQVQIKGKDEKASSILRRLLNNYRLSYVIFEDTVLITTEELALMRQMRQRVNVDLQDVPLKKAARDLAKNQGVNLVIDPKVAKEADTPVSLQVEGTSVETAVRLMAELASVKAVRMGNVLFITTPEKAKAIRAEEPHQMDNPMHPTFPGGVPPIAGGIGGGFGGAGIAQPGLPVFPQFVPGNAGPPMIDPAAPMPDRVPPPPVQKGEARPDGTTSSPPAPRVERPAVPDAPPRR